MAAGEVHAVTVDLTVNAHVLAKIAVQNIGLKAVLGAYELNIILSGFTTPEENSNRWAAIHGGRVFARFGMGPRKELGLARPDQPALIRHLRNSVSIHTSLNLRLTGHQLFAIEDQREGNELHFDIMVFGDGADKYDRHTFQSVLTFSVPQQDWIKQLRDAAVLDIVSIEVPMPVADATEVQRRIVHHLRQAQKHLIDQNYRACVAECRDVMKEIGAFDSDLGYYTQPRSTVGKKEREAAFFAGIQFYTHLAHHPKSEGGVFDYTRLEAKLLFNLAAICAECRLKARADNA